VSVFRCNERLVNNGRSVGPTKEIVLFVKCFIGITIIIEISFLANATLYRLHYIHYAHSYAHVNNNKWFSDDCTNVKYRPYVFTFYYNGVIAFRIRFLSFISVTSRA